MATNYYRPYSSDSDTDSGSESDSSTTSMESDSTSSSYASKITPAVPNFRALAQGLSLTQMGGPAMDASGSLAQGGASLLSSGYPTFKNYEAATDPSGGALKSSSQSVTSVIMLDSRDRDRGVFTQPTNLTLRLPRVYSNVTAFSLVQIKLLSAFFYFRPDKHNTNIDILELNRTKTDSAGNILPNIITSYLRQGTYDIGSLLAELSTQLNVTPLFYDFPNGFQDFAPRFAATGDFTINFNFPGDNYYDRLLSQFTSNPTTLSIVTKYFQGQYAGYSSYTTDQIKIAYYYPVVKEYLLDTTMVNLPLDLKIVNSVQYLLPTETVSSRCIYTFQGIDDPVILEVIALNITLLDSYRLQHTFRYALINKYNVTYETQSNRVTIASPTLNTSLVNLITFKQAQLFAEQLNAFKITQDTFNTYNTQNTILLAVLNDLFYYIQRWLAVYFGLDFNTFTLDYVAQPANLLPLRDGYQAVGVSSNYDANVIARNVKPISTDLLAPLKVSAPTYWNRLTNLPESTMAFPYNLETSNASTSSNYPFSILLEQQDREHKFVDSNGYLYANRLTRYADIVVPLEATKYTIFKFKSPVRQTLAVETLPRPTQFRYPAYNAANYDLSAQTLFDNSYSFVQNAQNAKMDVSPTFATKNLMTIPGFSNLYSTQNFGISYESSLALWSSNLKIIQVGDTRAFFQMRAPMPTNYTSTIAPGYRYPLSVTIAPATSSTFATAMNMYFYHDRGAFMADVSDNRNEKILNYLTSVSTTTEMSSATLNFQVYGNQTYYVLARSIDTAIATQHFRVVPWFPSGSNYTALTSSLVGFDPYADPQANLNNYNYAVNADPAFIRLPIQSSIYPPQTQDPLYTPLTFSTMAIGYDTNGVSTDLTDYCGFIGGFADSNSIPNASLRADPISGYIFQVGNGYDPIAQQYLTIASENTILQPLGAGVYSPGKVATRETSIVQWYGTSYIPNSENQSPMLSNNIVPSNVVVPYSKTITNQPLAGYTYGGSNNAIQFGDGVFGMSFVPSQGVWDIQRMMFKSIYTTSNAATDENLNIVYLGVYFSATTTNKFVHEILLDDAIAVLKFSKSVTYNSNYQDVGFDAGYGTYYEFVRDSNFQTGSNSYLKGYSQIRGQINTDINSIYSFIPFDGNKQFMTFQGLVGSPVPYPYYSDASAGLAYYDGTTAPTGKGIVIPKVKASPDTVRGPPTGYDQTQSQYEQSTPFGTNLLQYINPYPFALLSNTMKPWDPFPYSPSLIVGDVSGFIMTQDSFYRVFEYKAATEDYSLVEKYQFTLDQVYPSSNPAINFVGVAANESEYAFFAYSNLPTYSPGTNKLLIRTMSPFDGSVQQTYEYSDIPGFDPTAQQITNVTYNNYGGFTMALKSPSTLTAICKHSAASSTMTVINTLGLTGVNSNVDRLVTRQTPKEAFGSFYIFPYRTGLSAPYAHGGHTDYILTTPSNALVIPNPFYSYVAYSGPQDTWPTGSVPTQIQVFNMSNAPTTPAVFTEPIISRQPFKDYIYMLSDYDKTHFYQVTNFSASNSQLHTSNALMTTSRYQFPVATSNFTQGANGAKWSLIGNTLYGNRNDVVDSPRKIYQAWQLFYPLQRIVLKQISKNFTYLYDLSGLKYPEYPHTSIAAYDSLSNLQADITGKWGLESSNNFVVADFNIHGVIFNAFLFTFPLEKSTPTKPYYYLAVRNYSPTEKSQVLMRFSLTNQYDYGYISMSDLSDEVIISQTASNEFNPEYYRSLNGFNSNFVIGSNGQVFGANVVQGYAGSNFSNVTGFGDFYGRFISLYNQYNTQVQLVQTINSNVNTAVANFIKTDLQYILPATSLNRQRFTDPLTYTILWQSALLKEYSKLEENWGLGWNLGYAKADTPYETVHRADSFFKILDDFINLQMNKEFDMNRMDTGAKENLSRTLEPTGATKAFHGKLLLANFGSFAQTLVSNPISFYPPLGRMDKLTFTWVDITGATINNGDCEWNAVVQIVEKKDMTEITQAPRIDPTARSRGK